MQPDTDMAPACLLTHPASHQDAAASLAQRYERVRGQTRALAEPLSPEDCQIQSMPDCSPVKWHLAHTTWFFETFILARFLPGHPPFHPQYRMLFNSYYNAIGDRHPRPQRGMLRSEEHTSELQVLMRITYAGIFL